MRMSIFRPGFTPINEPGGPGHIILAGRFPKSSYFADAAPVVFETPPGFLRHVLWPVVAAQVPGTWGRGYRPSSIGGFCFVTFLPVDPPTLK
jgi:hypothetical protein